jgi:hypothetical protein
VACCRRLGDLLIDPRSIRALSTLERFAEGEVTAEEMREAERQAEAAETRLSDDLGLLEQTCSSGEPWMTKEALWQRHGPSARRYFAAAGVRAAVSRVLIRPPEPVMINVSGQEYNLVLDHQSGGDSAEAPDTVTEHCLVALGNDWSGGGLEENPSGESISQAGLLRDIVGNPFRPIDLDPSFLAWRAWNGRVVAHLAEAAYEARLTPGGQLDPARLAILADALEDAGGGDRPPRRRLLGFGPRPPQGVTLLSERDRSLTGQGDNAGRAVGVCQGLEKRMIATPYQVKTFAGSDRFLAPGVAR